jgi:hypothetical protein
MALGKIRLELARSAERGYAFAAPRADHGRLAARGWRARREACTVHRFRVGEDDAYRHLAPS